MLILSQADLIGLLPPAALIAPAESAALARAMERFAPRRQHIEWKGNTLLTMPAIAADLIGAKLVCVVPDNAARSLPVTSGVMVLSDGATGAPLAVLNAAALTALRTGAVGSAGRQVHDARGNANARHHRLRGAGSMAGDQCGSRASNQRDLLRSAISCELPEVRGNDSASCAALEHHALWGCSRGTRANEPSHRRDDIRHTRAS